MKNTLTPKQKLFCEEYLVDLNASQAARRVGYKHSSASTHAQKLMAQENVKNYISELMNARTERINISADKVLHELAAIAFSDIRDFVELKEEGLMVKPTADLTTEKARAIESLTENTSARGSKVSIKLHNKLKALELIGRHLSMFSDKVEMPQFTGFKIGYDSVPQISQIPEINSDQRKS